MTITISRTDLARNTRQIVEQVRKGQPVVVQSYGEDQVVLLDALDYKILRALVDYALNPELTVDVTALLDFDAIIRAYLDRVINLGKASELLGVSRFELMERFERLDIPLRLGHATMQEAQEEARAARASRISPK